MNRLTNVIASVVAKQPRGNLKLLIKGDCFAPRNDFVVRVHLC